MTRVLFTTVHRPLGIDSDVCTPNISAEMYHAQVTRAQDLFSIRSTCTGWGVEFIAANLDVPATVLHYPTLHSFERELTRGYDYVGISFVMCTFPKTVELCELIRRVAPQTKIVLGGYGTVIAECDRYADFVCREEGVNFMRRLLGERELETFRVPPITRTLRVLWSTRRGEAVLPTGLGCSRGCDFCCTSHFFGRTHVPLLKTGRQIHEAMKAVHLDGATYRNIGVIDEDFLEDRRRIDEMIPLNAGEVEQPILFSCLTSAKSLEQYSTDELMAMGLGGAWIGVESLLARFGKLRDVDVPAVFQRLRGAGIITLGSMILGLDGHDEASVEADFQYLLSLRPCFSQFMIYSPCPQTPLYARLERERRLTQIPYIYHDGFHALFTHPKLSAERLERLVLDCFRREYEELGPSVLRVAEVQLEGWLALRDRTEPHLVARAREYKNLCLEVYPLFGLAIRRAPTDRVRRWATELRERVEDAFRIGAAARVKTALVPALAVYAAVRDRLNPNPQPRSEVHRFPGRAAVAAIRN
jgi:haloalkane dehalogenase